MTAARFCSECGERLKVKRPGIPALSSFCPRCSARFRRFRPILIAVPVFCAAIGFALGHYTSARAPFYFIGTPVNVTANSGAPPDTTSDRSSRGSTTPPEQLLNLPGAADSVCGARTKSGKPCRRKVKGGGYCWQHRDQKGRSGK